MRSATSRVVLDAMVRPATGVDTGTKGSTVPRPVNRTRYEPTKTRVAYAEVPPVPGLTASSAAVSTFVSTTSPCRGTVGKRAPSSVTFPPKPLTLREKMRESQPMVRRPTKRPIRCCAIASGKRR